MTQCGEARVAFTQQGRQYLDQLSTEKESAGQVGQVIQSSSGTLHDHEVHSQQNDCVKGWCGFLVELLPAPTPTCGQHRLLDHRMSQ